MALGSAREAAWGLTIDELRRLVEGANDRRVVALDVVGVGEGARFTVVTAPGSVRQTLEVDVEGDLAASVLARRARENLGPVALAMSGVDRALRLVLVLEAIADAKDALELIAPAPFVAGPGEPGFVARAARLDGSVEAIAVSGAPTDRVGSGLRVAGLVRPRRDRARVGWAVFLDPRGPRGALAGPEAEALARAASPQAVHELGDGEAILSLWHDTVALPWPAPDCFARPADFAVDEGVDADALAGVLAARRAERRRLLSLGARETAAGPRYLVLHGPADAGDPLPRTFRAVESGDVAAPEDHPLDAWAEKWMRRSGARQGQLVVVRGARLAYARAFTFAEAGYPAATLDDALRLGSVTKAFTAIALLRALRARGLELGVDTPLSDPLLLGEAAAAHPRLAALTLRHLLAHEAGFPTSIDIAPDDPMHPLAEHTLARRLHRERRPLEPGELSRALLAAPELFFERDPGAGRAASSGYSNEGFVLLGELLGMLAGYGLGGFERALVELLFTPAGVDVGARGVVFGRGREASRARRESPAHPASPRWAENRFGREASAPALELSPAGDNGAFLGGAAGLSVPLVWLARVLAALGPKASGGLWTRADLDVALTPAAPGSTTGHGVHLSDPGWWTIRTPGRAPAAVGVQRLHHAGRVRGGSALLLYAVPRDPLDESARLGVVAAFNQLGDLYDDPHGRELVAILRSLEGDPGHVSRDLFAPSGDLKLSDDF